MNTGDLIGSYVEKMGHPPLHSARLASAPADDASKHNAAKIVDSLWRQVQGQETKPRHQPTGLQKFDPLTGEWATMGPPLADYENRSTYTTPPACQLTRDEWESALKFLTPIAEDLVEQTPLNRIAEMSNETSSRLSVESGSERFAIAANTDNLYLSDRTGLQNPSHAFDYDKLRVAIKES